MVDDQFILTYLFISFPRTPHFYLLNGDYDLEYTMIQWNNFDGVLAQPPRNLFYIKVITSNVLDRFFGQHCEYAIYYSQIK